MKCGEHQCTALEVGLKFAHLIQDVLPILDERNHLSGRRLVLYEQELGLHLPYVELLQGLPDDHLSRSPGWQFNGLMPLFGSLMGQFWDVFALLN